MTTLYVAPRDKFSDEWQKIRGQYTTIKSPASSSVDSLCLFCRRSHGCVPVCVPAYVPVCMSACMPLCVPVCAPVSVRACVFCYRWKRGIGLTGGGYMIQSLSWLSASGGRRGGRRERGMQRFIYHQICRFRLKRPAYVMRKHVDVGGGELCGRFCENWFSRSSWLVAGGGGGPGGASMFTPPWTNKTPGLIFFCRGGRGPDFHWSRSNQVEVENSGWHWSRHRCCMEARTAAWGCFFAVVRLLVYNAHSKRHR